MNLSVNEDDRTEKSPGATLAVNMQHSKNLNSDPSNFIKTWKKYCVMIYTLLCPSPSVGNIQDVLVFWPRDYIFHLTFLGVLTSLWYFMSVFWSVGWLFCCYDRSVIIS